MFSAKPLLNKLSLLSVTYARQAKPNIDRDAQMAEECIAVGDEYGWAIAEPGQVEKGISIIRAALDAEHAAGGEINHPQKLAWRRFIGMQAKRKKVKS
jgi:hypothetical protein